MQEDGWQLEVASFLQGLPPWSVAAEAERESWTFAFTCEKLFILNDGRLTEELLR